MTIFRICETDRAPSDLELVHMTQQSPTEFFYCKRHGIIADALLRHWDNGDPDPLHASVWEDYCPRCGIECLPLYEWLTEFWEEAQ